MHAKFQRQFMHCGIVLGAAILFVSCAGPINEPDPTLTNAPTSSGLPDLTLSYESEWDECSATMYFLSVTITNEGTGDASSFNVFVNPGDPVAVDGLAAGESLTLDVARTLFLNVVVDVDEAVAELDESNNELNLFGGTSSRPCFTPTP